MKQGKRGKGVTKKAEKDHGGNVLTGRRSITHGVFMPAGGREKQKMGLLRYLKYCILSASALIRMTGICGGVPASVFCMKKIYTCTPVSFAANNGFWIRDTGLISRNLRRAGVESKCVMPLPWHDDDDDKEHLIRISLREMESPEWWKSLQLDGLVLYSWGLPKYLKIAKAVHKAGIPCMLHWDGGATTRRLFSPKYHILQWLRALHMHYVARVSMPPPVVLSYMREVPFRLIHLSDKCLPMPCPVDTTFQYDGREKENLVICIGRWADEKQKRQHFMMQTLENYYSAGGEAVTEIYGKLTPELRAWHAALPSHTKNCVQLKGYINNADLLDVYNRAKVILCPSSHESSHIVSAEALCCGASVVVTNRPLPLATVRWYTTQNSGTISEEDTPVSLAEALYKELQIWANGGRNPAAIAASWQPYFHPDKVLKSFIGADS